MEIGDWRSTQELNSLYRRIRELGLESNIAELDAFGFTVIEGALTPDQTTRIRDTIVGIAEKRLGHAVDIDAEDRHADLAVIPYLLYKDAVFEEAVLNEKPLALITYLLGQHCNLSSLVSHFKGPGGNGLLLHHDTGNGMPMPQSPYAHVANCNYALTDYTEAAGALAIVPGSHRFSRRPTAAEVGLMGDARNPDVVPVEVPAGSAIIWHGSTWHGSFPRQIPGLRINLSMFFCRQYLETQERYRETVPQDFLDRYPPGARMRTLLGQEKVHGWTDGGPPPDFYPKSAAVARSWHA